MREAAPLLQLVLRDASAYLAVYVAHFPYERDFGLMVLRLPVQAT